MIYDKLTYWRSKSDPYARYYNRDDVLCRIEIQFKGRGVHYKNLADIRKYAEFEILRGVRFSNHLEIRAGLKPRHELAALGFRNLAQQYGLQGVLKRYPSAPWKNYFVSTVDSQHRMSNRLCERAWLTGWKFELDPHDSVRRTGYAIYEPRHPFVFQYTRALAQ